MHLVSFGPLVSFFKIILRCFLILTSIVLRFSNVPNQRCSRASGIEIDIMDRIEIRIRS